MKHIYPDQVDELGLTRLIQEFIYNQYYPHLSMCNFSHLPPFYKKITIYMSTVATFHAPSDPSGIGSMKHECIHAVSHWRKDPGHFNTLFINAAHDNVESDDESTSNHGFLGLEVARAHLFFSFTHNGVKYPCALVHWFSHMGDMPSDITGMYIVEPDHLPTGQPVTTVVHLDTIVRATHLLPVFSNHSPLSKHQHHVQTLNSFSEFYIN